MSNDDQPCARRCRSSEHGNIILSALTKRGVSDGELCAYLNHVCEFCGSSKDLGGRTSLHVAASCGRTDLCKWLICQKRARIDERDMESGYTALHRSIFYGKIDTAVALIKLGANINTLDCNNLSPLEHAAEDNNDALKISVQPTKDNKTQPTHFVYVWGTNSNYTLGSQESKSPQLFDTFHKTYPHAKVRQVCLEKFHTLILTESGEVYSFGLGQGARLGLGTEKSIVEPTLIKFGQGATKCVIKSISAARNHSMFLTDSGNVYICGINTHNVLGFQPPPQHLLTPKLLSNSNFKDKVIGVCCGRYHSVLWTKNMIYTWGLHAGQLGHAKNPSNYIITPKSVPFTTTMNETEIIAVAASAGATTFATRRGDVYVLHQFVCRRIASRELHIKSLSIIGGSLSVENNDVEVTNSELKVLVLTTNGMILIWQESDPQLCRCIFSLNRLINVESVVLHSWGLFILTKSREIFNGKLRPRKKTVQAEKKKEVQDKNSKPFHKFLDKNDCVMVQVSKVHKIYGADDVTCDSEGENFAALHINIACCVKNSPKISPSTMSEDFKTLILNDDVVEDVFFKVKDRTFSAHKFIIANCSEILHKMIKEATTDTININNVHPEMFEQILKYAYTNECDLMKEGKCPSGLLQFWVRKNRNAKEDDFVEFVEIDEDKSAFEVYSENKWVNKINNGGNKMSEKENLNLDPVRLLQETAKKLGVNNLCKDLGCFVFNNGNISVKSNAVFKARTLRYENEKFCNYYDATITSKNGGRIEAHKCVLVARSEFFNHMFSVRWSEAQSKSEISLPFPQNTLNHLISYLYTDHVNLEEEDVDGLSNLMILADHILLPRLIEICEYHLSKLISMKTVIKLLSLAYHYNAKQLKTSCMEYISLNLSAILEDRYLEQLDGDVVKDLTKFYSEWNEKMPYRVITPFCDAVDDEIVQKISSDHPVNMDFGEEIVKDSTPPKQSQRRRNRSHKISFSEKVEFKPEKGESTVAAPVVTEVVAPRSRLDTILSAKAKLDESVEGSDFVSLIGDDNGFPDLNRSRSGSDIYSKSPKSHEKFDRMPKLSQKQRKMLSSESSSKEQVVEPPKNPWKIIEPVSPIGSPNENVTMNNIIIEEKKQKDNLVKLKSKLLVHTQMEDKALEELRKFYNIDNVFDEIIIAERVCEGVVATPVWVQK